MAKKERSSTQFDFRRPRDTVESVLACVRSGSDPNKGTLTPQEYLAAWRAFEDGDAGCPHIYQPALIEAAQKLGSKVATCGRGKSQPDDWDEDQLGKWHCSKDEQGNSVKGDVLEDPRIHHLTNLCKVIDEGALLSFDEFGTFVVGTEALPAIHCIRSHRTGNYAAVIACLKSLAFEESQVANLVGHLNDAIEGEEVEDGGFLVWNPHQIVTWGHLMRNGKQMSIAQIHKMKVTDHVEFRPLTSPVVGRNVSLDELTKAVKEVMVGIEKSDGLSAWQVFCDSPVADEKGFDKTRTNVGTLCRNSPTVLNCFGLKNCQMGLPVFKSWEGSTVEDAKEVVSMAIGMRLTVEVAENKWEMMARLRPDKVEQSSTEVVSPSQEEVVVPPQEVAPTVTDEMSPAAIAAEEDGE